MKFLLDTNAAIQLMAAHGKLTSWITQQDIGNFAISSIVMFELYYGAFNSRQVESNLIKIDNLRIATLDVSVEDARIAGSIRAELAAKGTPIGSYDLLIAGQAIAHSLTLITNNVREFRRVRDLKYKDWKTL